MENRPRNTNLGPFGLGRWPTILGIVTMATFVGSMIVFDIKPWGPWVAIALLSGWTFAVALSCASQDRLDKAAGRVPDRAPKKTSRLAQIVQALFLLGSLVCFAYGQWLRYQGEPHEISQPYSDAALLLLVLSSVVSMATEAIMHRWSRRQSTLTKST